MDMTFGDIGSLSSIVGLALTIYVFLGVRKIKQEFLFKARLPGLHKKIQEHASTISTLMKTFPDSKDAIVDELSIAQVNVKSLEDKSSGTIRESLKSLRVKIESLRSTHEMSIEKKSIRAIYLEMNMVIQEITNLKEDDMWRRGSG